MCRIKAQTYLWGHQRLTLRLDGSELQALTPLDSWVPLDVLLQ